MNAKLGVLYGVYSDERQAWGAYTKHPHKWHPPHTLCESKECTDVKTPWHPRGIRMNLWDLQTFFDRANLHDKGYRIQEINDETVQNKSQGAGLIPVSKPTWETQAKWRRPAENKRADSRPAPRRIGDEPKSP